MPADFRLGTLPPVLLPYALSGPLRYGWQAKLVLVTGCNCLRSGSMRSCRRFWQVRLLQEACQHTDLAHATVALLLMPLSAFASLANRPLMHHLTAG